MSKIIELPTCTCLRCGEEWHPRKPIVMTCPKCRSPYWDTPRRSETEEGAE